MRKLTHVIEMLFGTFTAAQQTTVGWRTLVFFSSYDSQMWAPHSRAAVGRCP